MAKKFNVPFNQTSPSNQPEFADDFADTQFDCQTDVRPDVPPCDVAAFQRLDLTGAELATQSKASVRLDLENLKCFEVVDQQFEQCGVTFSNAIALHPSNPAYPPQSGMTVLMGSPKPGWLEARFRRPVRFVSGHVTSSRRAVLAAFDANNQPLTQAELSKANLAGSGSEIPPNARLSLSAANIHRITFYAFDGQLTLDEFNFGF